MPSLRTQISLPNQTSVIPLARSYVRELATLAEFTGEQITALEAALDEACANIILHAFAPGESGTFSVAAEVSPTAMELSIRDQGLPYDPALIPTANGLGRGLRRIRDAVDEAHWINHGKDGKELRLVKLRSHVHVTEQLTEADLTPISRDAPLAPPQKYTIRRFRPDDALGVAQCVYRVYGYTYPNEDLYYPERVSHLNATGEQIAVVAVDGAGAVAGHYALERPGYERVAESGEAVVSPAHRGRGLLERMRGLLEEEGRAAGLAGIFGEATTNHVFSQRSDEKAGCRVCAVIFGEWPSSVTFKGIPAGPQPQRLSYVVYFKFLQRPATVVAHVPPRHRQIVGRIYSGLEVPVEFCDRRGPQQQGRLAVKYQMVSRSGYIRVRQVGADTAAEVHRAFRDLCEVSGAEAVYLELPLAHPGVPELAEAAEADGFFFGGIGPQFAVDGDVLRLQYLAHDLDPTLLQLASPFARELADYAHSERQRVKSGD